MLDTSPTYNVLLDDEALPPSSARFFDNFNFGIIKPGEVIYLEDLDVDSDFAVLVCYRGDLSLIELATVSAKVAEALEARESAADIDIELFAVLIKRADEPGTEEHLYTRDALEQAHPEIAPLLAKHHNGNFFSVEYTVDLTTVKIRDHFR